MRIAKRYDVFVRLNNCNAAMLMPANKPDYEATKEPEYIKDLNMWHITTEKYDNIYLKREDVDEIKWNIIFND